ncbi:unnamed protein product [Ectocarpus sp. 12 AP-2014]
MTRLVCASPRRVKRASCVFFFTSFDWRVTCRWSGRGMASDFAPVGDRVCSHLCFGGAFDAVPYSACSVEGFSHKRFFSSLVRQHYRKIVFVLFPLFLFVSRGTTTHLFCSMGRCGSASWCASAGTCERNSFV